MRMLLATAGIVLLSIGSAALGQERYRNLRQVDSYCVMVFLEDRSRPNVVGPEDPDAREEWFWHQIYNERGTRAPDDDSDLDPDALRIERTLVHQYTPLALDARSSLEGTCVGIPSRALVLVLSYEPSPDYIDVDLVTVDAELFRRAAIIDDNWITLPSTWRFSDELLVLSMGRDHVETFEVIAREAYREFVRDVGRARR